MRSRTFVVTAASAAMICIAASCGGSVADGDQQAAKTPDLGCGTLHSGTCPAGEYCHGPPTCGAKWSCQKSHPCSAAAGGLACSCDGRVVSVAAGCPDRHAYGVSDAFGQNVGLKMNEPCDASRRTPFRIRIEIAGSGFEAFDGGRFRLRARGARPSWFPADGLPINQGRFDLTSDEFTRTKEDDLYLEMLVDRTGNGTCEVSEDLAWTGPPSSADGVTFVVRFDVTPPTPDRTDPTYCERWR